MILTSNRSVEEWGEVLGDTVVAAVILDRLLHHSYIRDVDTPRLVCLEPCPPTRHPTKLRTAVIDERGPAMTS